MALNSSCSQINGSVDCDPEVEPVRPGGRLVKPDQNESSMYPVFPLLPHRPSLPQIIPSVLQPGVFSSNTTMRACSRGTCLTCRSTTWWPSSGVLILSLPWASAPSPGRSRPTTGRLPNQTTSPRSPYVPASFAPSGRFLHRHHRDNSTRFPLRFLFPVCCLNPLGIAWTERPSSCLHQINESKKRMSRTSRRNLNRPTCWEGDRQLPRGRFRSRFWRFRNSSSESCNLAFSPQSNDSWRK